MIEAIKKLFQGDGGAGAQDGFSQQEREAIIDVILLSMYADNKLDLGEQDILHQHTGSLSWDSGTYVDIYVNQAIGVTRQGLATEEGTTRLIQSIADRLDSDDAKQRVMEICEKVLLADGVKTDDELSFQQELKRYVGLG